MGDLDHRDAEDRLQVWGSASQPSKARLRAGVVFREAGSWSRTVLALLRHLEDAGFAGAPRVVGSGFAEDGREMVSYIPGASPQPYAWSEDAVAGVGTLLRDLHSATATFTPPAGACWKTWFGRDLPGTRPVIGHCDAGPWNIIARDGHPVALIDFEFAGPVDAVWELAEVAWLNAQLHDDDVVQMHGLPDLAARARQLRLILDGHGLPAGQRADFVDKMITFAVHSARAEAVEAGVTPQTTEGVTRTGYPNARGDHLACPQRFVDARQPDQPPAGDQLTLARAGASVPARLAQTVAAMLVRLVALAGPPAGWAG